MNDPKLKFAVARLLPEQLYVSRETNTICWGKPIAGTMRTFDGEARETEWLYVMQLVEQTLTKEQFTDYTDKLCDDVACGYPDPEIEELISLTFNQRATAMCKVKGIEI